MFDTSQDAYIAFHNIVAERTSPIMAWVGSGLSRRSGLPDWVDLRDRLCEVAINKANTLIGSDAEALRAKAQAAQTASDFWLAFEILSFCCGNRKSSRIRFPWP
jgi:hypothetical protein